MDDLFSALGPKGSGLLVTGIILAIIAAILCYGFSLVLPYLAHFGFGYILGIIFLAVGGLGQLSYIRNKNKVNLVK